MEAKKKVTTFKFKPIADIVELSKSPDYDPTRFVLTTSKLKLIDSVQGRIFDIEESNFVKGFSYRLKGMLVGEGEEEIPFAWIDWIEPKHHFKEKRKMLED
jgi:hypothetical protein